MKNDYLIHYGTKGQKWGVRKYQNEDGSLTPAGKERYYDGPTQHMTVIKVAEAKRGDRYNDYDMSSQFAALGKKNNGERLKEVGKTLARAYYIGMGADKRGQDDYADSRLKGKSVARSAAKALGGTFVRDVGRLGVAAVGAGLVGAAIAKLSTGSFYSSDVLRAARVGAVVVAKAIGTGRAIRGAVNSVRNGHRASEAREFFKKEMTRK